MVAERLQLLHKAKNNSELQSKMIKLIQSDWYFFFNSFLYTYDPRTKSKIIPFRLYEFQVDLIQQIDDCYNNKQPLLVEKSRDMGFSWCFLGWIVWKMVTEKNFSAGVGSRKFGLVHEIGNMDSLLEKVTFMLGNLPNWMISFNKFRDSKLGQVNVPELASTVTGEAGDNIGRGGRKSAYFLDEFAHIPRSPVVNEAVALTSDFLCYGSTPNGKGNEFARFRWKTDMKRVTLHWKRHPNKDQEWYDNLRKLLTEAQMAQEVDISYAKSIAGKVHQWFDSNKMAHVSIEHNPDYPVVVTFDFGIGDPTSVLIIQDYDNIVRVIKHFETADTIFPKIMNRLEAELRKFKVSIRDVGGWYGDPDGNNRERITGDTIKSWSWDRYKIRFNFKYPNSIRNRLTSVRLLGEANRIIIDKEQTLFIDTMENYKFPEKEHGENDKPVHDWCSHAQSALEYYCVYEHGMNEYEQAQHIQSIRIR